MEQSNTKEALGYFVQHAGSAFIKLFQVVIPEIKKFDDELNKISVKTRKIKNKTNKSKKIPTKPVQPVKQEQSEKPSKSDFKVLS
jgi:hypothetical protein